MLNSGTGIAVYGQDAGISSGQNVIGGSTAGAGNVISGNFGDGIFIAGGVLDIVAGNLIGTNASGTAEVLNDRSGIVIEGGSENTVGGTSAGAGNVISGNQKAGVAIEHSPDNFIQGNRIGTNSSGTGAIGNEYGVAISGAGSSGSIRGNVIGGVTAGAGNVISGNDVGIFITDGFLEIVAGNLIGTDAAGTAAVANGAFGIFTQHGSGNTIGGTTAGAGNVVSGNTGDGIVITEEMGDLVAGNKIGTDITGTVGVGNGQAGVFMFAGASDNTIGGTAAGDGNLISGDELFGVELGENASKNVVAGNKIGTDITGTVAIANGTGVEIDDAALSGNTIGGATPGSGNVISGNTGAGIYLRGLGFVVAGNNVVAGNLIGTDVTGTVAIPNYAGVEIDTRASDNLIGASGANSTSDALERNVISGNLFAGVWMTGTGTDNNVVAGNYIGTDVTGTVALGNGSVDQEITSSDGYDYFIGGDIVIEAGASDNLIGTSGHRADDAGQRNIISGSDGNGVDLYGSGTTGDVVAGNYIGTDPAGSAEIGNPYGTGIFFAEVSSCWAGVNPVYGAEDADQGNVISGDGGGGVQIFDSSAVVVAGNLIGTDAAGTAAFPNAVAGVLISDSSSSNRVGTSGQDGAADALERNVISGNDAPGVVLGTTFPGGVDTGAVTGNVVAGNYIGTDAAGTAALGNTGDGVEIITDLDPATSNWVGVNSVYGPANADQDNLISGNTEDGVEITGAGTTGNVVAGNLIGTDVTGTVAVANGGNGVEIDTGASGNLIGGSTAAARNILSGNFDSGVEINDANDNLVEGNYAGTDITGTVALANNPTSTLAGGVTVDNGAAGNTIGGLTATPGTGVGNVLSGNIFAGVLLYYAGSNNLVAGNLIGTDPSGTVALGNYDPNFIYGGFGVCLQFSADNIIGEPGGRNVISANGPLVSNSANVSLYYSSGTVVQSNYIGTDITGTVALSHGTYSGIGTQFGSYTIGGLTSTPGTGLGNVISGNEFGVLCFGGGGPYSISIEGNIVGADPSGELAVTNRQDGIGLQDVSMVTIGGTAAGEGNLISGNNNAGSPGGVYIFGGSTQNVVEGNLIGTDITGLKALVDTVATEYGVLINSGSSGNTIGGTTAAARNVISGNYGWGVGIDGPTTTGNVVEGNYVGTNLNGTANLGNAAANPQSIGVIISNAPGNTIGGTAAGSGNVISGNSEYGVQITDYNYVNQDLGSSATGNVIAGNRIGTNRDGTAVLGNTTDGVLVGAGASGNTIGGTTPGAGNLISGNGNGVEINGAGSNEVQGNLIGTDWTGTLALGNSGAGVLVDAGSSANTIGGPVGGSRNVISGNAEGVEITAATGTIVAGNLIGTDITGSVLVGNRLAGVSISGAVGTTIGGTTVLAQNVISGNAGDGIDVAGGSMTTVIQGNYIGADQTGTQPLGNQGIGLSVDGARASRSAGRCMVPAT